MNNVKALYACMLQDLFNGVLGGPIWHFFAFSTKALNIHNSRPNATSKVGMHLGVIGLHPLHFPPFVKVCFIPKHILCRNPTLAKCGGEAQHFQSWGFGVLRDSRLFRVRQQGPKHLSLRCFWCHWKGLEA